jgi:hypothetical protein
MSLLDAQDMVAGAREDATCSMRYENVELARSYEPNRFCRMNRERVIGLRLEQLVAIAW